MAEGHPSPEQLASMLRTLLADRFDLRTHDETRELPVCALEPGEVVPCGTVKFGGGRLVLRGMPMSRIVREVLSNLVNPALSGRGRGRRGVIHSPPFPLRQLCRIRH